MQNSSTLESDRGDRTFPSCRKRRPLHLNRVATGSGVLDSMLALLINGHCQVDRCNNEKQEFYVEKEMKRVRDYGVLVTAFTFIFTCALVSPARADSNHDKGRTHYYAPHAQQAPQVDGIADEPIWQQAKWQEINHRWLGPEYSSDDFAGRYKIVWTQSKLYFLGEFVDDVLTDTHRNPLEQYWDDDTLEIFIDEDHSGGNHKYTHNAFAYHLSLDNQAIDIGTNKQAQSYTHHLESRWQQHGNKIIWEVSIDIYTDAYRDGAHDNKPAVLSAGKIMGLMVAYCDNDRSELRENFIGSEYAAGDNKDRGYIDAGLFGTLELVE